MSRHRAGMNTQHLINGLYNLKGEYTSTGHATYPMTVEYQPSKYARKLKVEFEEHATTITSKEVIIDPSHFHLTMGTPLYKADPMEIKTYVRFNNLEEEIDEPLVTYSEWEDVEVCHIN